MGAQAGAFHTSVRDRFLNELTAAVEEVANAKGLAASSLLNSAHEGLGDRWKKIQRRHVSADKRNVSEATFELIVKNLLEPSLSKDQLATLRTMFYDRYLPTIASSDRRVKRRVGPKSLSFVRAFQVFDELLGHSRTSEKSLRDAETLLNWSAGQLGEALKHNRHGEAIEIGLAIDMVVSQRSQDFKLTDELTLNSVRSSLLAITGGAALEIFDQHNALVVHDRLDKLFCLNNFIPYAAFYLHRSHLQCYGEQVAIGPDLLEVARSVAIKAGERWIETEDAIKGAFERHGEAIARKVSDEQRWEWVWGHDQLAFGTCEYAEIILSAIKSGIPSCLPYHGLKSAALVHKSKFSGWKMQLERPAPDQQDISDVCLEDLVECLDSESKASESFFAMTRCFRLLLTMAKGHLTPTGFDLDKAQHRLEDALCLLQNYRVPTHLMWAEWYACCASLMRYRSAVWSERRALACQVALYNAVGMVEEAANIGMDRDFIDDFNAGRATSGSNPIDRLLISEPPSLAATYRS